MGRRDFQSNVADALPIIIEEQAKNGIGSVRFYKKDKKIVGKLYFRGGAIYAIEVSTYNPNVVNRIATNEYISPTNREKLLDHFKDDVTNPEVFKYVLTYQLFPEKPLMTYIKDYFLDAFDELYSWDSVNAEWRTGDEPSANIQTVPQADPFELIDKLKKRKAYLETEIAPLWNTAPNKMDSLAFRSNVEYTDPDYITTVILSLADGKYTIGAIADYLGLSHFNTKLVVFELWKEGIVDVVHPAGLIISNRNLDSNKTVPVSSPEVIEEEKNLGTMEDTLVEPEVETEVKAQPEPLVEKKTPQPLVKPVLVNRPQPIAVKPIIKETIQNPVVEETTVVNVDEIQIIESPEQETELIIHDENSSETEEVTLLFSSSNEDNENMSSIEENITEEIINESDKEIIVVDQTASNRIRAIAEQLRQELGEMKKSIENVKEAKISKERYMESLNRERTVLLDKLRSLDASLAEEEKSVEAYQKDIDELEKDYNETIKLAQGLN